MPALVAAAVAVAVGGTLAATAGDDPDRRAAAPEASAEPSPSASAPAPPADTPGAEQPSPAPEEPAAQGVPAGWTTDTGEAGWTVALPPGYEQTRAGEYQDPSGRTLRVDSGPGKPDAVADREAQAEDFARRHPSYKEIRIDSVDYRGYEAADWEFTYEGLHVINRVFVVDGVGHSLFFQTKAGDFAEAQQDFDSIAAAFSPVGG